MSEENTIHLLDHGYVKPILFWGDEKLIIESARMSTGGEFKGWDKDFRLLKYLYEHRHDTPFEFVGMTLEVKAPMFVFREWHRHRTMSYNEASARYIPLPDEKYIPTAERIMRGIAEAGHNTQAGSDTDHALKDFELDMWLNMVAQAYDAAEAAYQYGLSHGVPKELARVTMPVAQYSTMRVNTNLRNWLGFLYLRQADNAQEEIRVYADAVASLLNTQFSNTMKLFEANK
jgi:thymidylate synthase (FAD)